MADFIYGEITEKIIGAAFRVHGTLGTGFQEVIYQRAMALELNVIQSPMSESLRCPFIIWKNI